RRRRFPGYLEKCCRLDRVFLTLGDDADEVADPDDGGQPRDIADRRLVDGNETGADEITGIDAGIGRAYDAAMKHAGHAHVVNVDQFAGGLGRQISARHRVSENAIVFDGFALDVVSQFKPDDLVADQFAVADAAVVPADLP